MKIQRSIDPCYPEQREGFPAHGAWLKTGTIFKDNQLKDMSFLCGFGFAKNQDYNGEDHVNGRRYRSWLTLVVTVNLALTHIL